MPDVLSDFIKGLVIGVSIAAPVGPIGILCIRTTLASGMTAGVATGLGAAVADAIYAAVGAMGVGAAAVALESAGPALQLVGIGVLLWLAAATWRRAGRAATPTDGAAYASLAAAFAGTCALTLANPMTILSFAAIFAGAGLSVTGDGLAARAAALVGGTFVGSLAWWLALSGAVALLRGRIGPGAMTAINKAAALVLAGFAAGMAAQALYA